MNFLFVKSVLILFEYICSGYCSAHIVPNMFINASTAVTDMIIIIDDLELTICLSSSLNISDAIELAILK